MTPSVSAISFGASAAKGGGSSLVLVTCSRDLDLEQVGERLVHGGHVLLHDFLALAAVGLLDGVFDLLDGLLARQHAGEREEAGLHDGIDARAHAGGLGDADRVNHVELDLLLDQGLLGRPRELVPDLVHAVVRVEQERAAGHQVLEHVVAVQEDRLMAGDEIGLADQVDRANRLRAEAQVRDGHRAGLLRVIDEVALRVVVGVLADDLDGILVGADRAVRAQPVEHARGRPCRTQWRIPGSHARLLLLTSSSMPTVKWFFG